MTKLSHEANKRNQDSPHSSLTFLRKSAHSKLAGVLWGRNSRLMPTIGVALCASCAMVQAQSWGTVDDIDAPSANAREVIADSAGRIFACGSIKDETSRHHAVVMRSGDGGATWETSADYPAVIDGIVAPPGSAAGFSAIASAITRSNATGTWATTDDYSLASTGYSEGESITADPWGNLFASGLAFDAAGVYHGWLVRRKPAP